MDGRGASTRGPLGLASRCFSGGAWVVAAGLAALLVHVPLHARIPASGGPIVPFDPEVGAPGTPGAPGPRRAPPRHPPKHEDKPIEFAPWERVPT